MPNQNARALRKHLTDAEQCLWRQLRRRQLDGVRFRRQQPIGPYIVDFVCFERRLIVEVDGGQHAEYVAYDTDRTKFLEQQGYRVLRFWNNEVLAQTASVAQVILGCVESAASPPHPNLPPQGGKAGLAR